MTLSSVSLIIRGYPGGGILPGNRLSRRESRGVEESDRAEIAAGGPAAGQTRPPAPPSVRVRPGQRDPDAAADRPGDRARPARLLPQPRLQGPRLPVPARHRGRLLGPRLPDR